MSPMNNRLLRPTTGLDPDAAKYLAAVEAADGESLEPAVRTAINTFIKGLKADGIWDAIKASCILCGARTLNGALVPLAGTAPTNNNFISDDYARGGATPGLKGDATTKSISTGRSANASAQNSFHMSVYLSELASAGASTYYIGVSYATGWDAIYQRDSPSGQAFANRNITFQAYSPQATGFLGSTRGGSGSFATRHNGASDTVSTASQSPTSNIVHVFSQSSGGENTDARIAFYSLGDNISLPSLESRVSALVTAIGAAV